MWYTEYKQDGAVMHNGMLMSSSKGAKGFTSSTVGLTAALHTHNVFECPDNHEAVLWLLACIPHLASLVSESLRRYGPEDNSANSLLRLKIL